MQPKQRTGNAPSLLGIGLFAPLTGGKIGQHQHLCLFGQRIEQTVSAQVSKYLLDLSLGLQETLVATTGANIERYVHGPMGLFSQRDSANNWETPLADGLGSIRSVVDTASGVQLG